MKVATVSGRCLEFDHVWINCNVTRLPKDLRETLKEKCKGTEGSFANYYIAQGEKTVNGETVTEQLIVTRKEAEKIIKKLNRPCVWFDTLDTGWEFWISYADEEELRDKKSWTVLHWDYIGRDGGDAPDGFSQWLVHEFYIRDGYEGALKSITEGLAKIKIPQRKEYCAPPSPPDFDIFEEEPKSEKEYIEAVKDAVDSLRKFERAKNVIESFGPKWRIVHIPTGDPAGKNGSDESGYPALTQDNLKNWLNFHFVSQAKAAELCCVPPRTFRRWVAGKPPIPKAAIELLKSKITPK